MSKISTNVTADCNSKRTVIAKRLCSVRTPKQLDTIKLIDSIRLAAVRLFGKRDDVFHQASVWSPNGL